MQKNLQHIKCCSMCWKTEEVFICQNGVSIMNRVTTRILNGMGSVLTAGNMFITGMTVNIAERKKSNKTTTGKYLFFVLCCKNLPLALLWCSKFPFFLLFYYFLKLNTKNHPRPTLLSESRIF